ncbi:MAG: PAS domain S-box protein [Candidatus Omnitrophota bacterium]
MNAFHKWWMNFLWFQYVFLFIQSSAHSQNLPAAAWRSIEPPIEKLDQPWKMQSYIEDAALHYKLIFHFDFDRLGNVWFATEEGLYQYDGYVWRRYTESEGLPTRFVRCVLSASDGRLWVGTDRGAGVYDGATFQSFDSQTGLAKTSVRRIVEDKDGALWFCCDRWPQENAAGGLFSYRNGEWKIYGEKDGLPSDYIVDYFRDSQNRQFVLTSKGLAQWMNGRWINPLEMENLPGANDFFWCIAESPQWGVLATTAKAHYLLKNGQWIRFDNLFPKPNKICSTRDGLLISCQDTETNLRAFLQWNGWNFTAFSGNILNPIGNIEFCREAPDGSLWAVGYACIMRWMREGSEWREYENLPPPRCVDRQGRVWFAGEEGIVRYDGGRQWKTCSAVFDNIALGRDNDVWGWKEKVIARFAGDEIVDYGLDETGLAQPQGFNKDSQGKIWFNGLDKNGNQALSVFDGKNWNPLILPELQSGRIVQSASDPIQGMWYLLEKEKKFELYYINQEMAQKQRLDDLVANAGRITFFVNRKRELWFYGETGVYSYVGPEGKKEWMPIVGIPGKNVFSMFEDNRRDDVWFGYYSPYADYGVITRLNKLTQKWDYYAVDARRFGKINEEGTILFGGYRRLFIASEKTNHIPIQLTIPNAAEVHDAFIDQRGDIWIQTEQSTLRYHPDEIKPKTVIVNVPDEILEGEAIDVKLYGIERYSPHLSDRNFHFSWRIDEGEWSLYQEAQNRTISISGFRSGRRTIYIRARDEGLDIEDSPVQHSFYVRPNSLFGYASIQAFFVIGFSLISFLAVYSLWARRKIAQYAARLQENLEVRTSELKHSEERFRNLVDQAAEFIIVNDEDGRIIDANRYACESLGYAREELLSLTLNDLEISVPFQIKSAVMRELTPDAPVTVPGIFQRKDGSRFPIEARVGLFESGSDRFYLALVRDITERKRAENELARRELLYRTLVDNAPLCIYLLDRELRTISANKSYCEIYGFRLEEIVGKTSLELFPSPYGEQFHNSDKQVLNSGQPLEIVKRHSVLGDRWVEMFKTPVRDAEGKITGVLGIFSDITERRKSEEKLRFQAAILENMNEWVVVADPQGRIAYLSPSVENDLEFTPGDLIGKSVSEIFGPYLIGATPQEIMEATRKGQWKGEIIFRMEDEDDVFISLQTSVIHNEKGEIVNLIGVARNITELKKLEEQLRQSLKMEAVGQLAGGVAHDFNNLLTGIIGNICLAQMKFPERIDKHLVDAKMAADRAASLVKQLLAFSRKSDIALQPIHLNEVVREICRLIGETFDRRIQIVMRLEENLPTILADYGQIQSAAMNLCVNARDAIQDAIHNQETLPRMDNHYEIVLETSAAIVDRDYCQTHPFARLGRYIVLGVYDNGIGMDETTQQRAFDPFFTTKEVGKGTGLGLASAYGIVKQHNGWIELESQPGEGTRFKIYLPVQEDVNLTKDIEEEPPAPAGFETILLVDDEEMIRNIAKESLENLGYTVLLAADGKEGLNLFLRNKNRIHLTILDLSMPEMSGREVLAAIKNDAPDAKVIISSGYSEAGQAEDLLRFGAAEIVSKPYRLSDFSLKIRQVLDETL